MATDEDCLVVVVVVVVSWLIFGLLFEVAKPLNFVL